MIKKILLVVLVGTIIFVVNQYSFKGLNEETENNTVVEVYKTEQGVTYTLGNGEKISFDYEEAELR